MGDYTRFTHKPLKRYSGVLMQQGRVQLDADWNEEIEILKRRWEVQARDTFGLCAVPKATTPQAFKITQAGLDLRIGEGRIYVHGLLSEHLFGETYLNNPISYKNQPYYPLPPSLPAGNAIVYLDVWERERTYVEDPELLEVALGGPDTTTRIQTVWQVKVYDRGTNNVTCDNLDVLPPPSSGGLSTRAQAVPASDDPCIVSPTGGYRGLENRLYRIEIQDPGTGPISALRFKWSRDNASLVSSVTHIEKTVTQTLLTVSRIGRDSVMRFQAGDWVEVLDDFRELMGQAGVMAQVAVPPDEANSQVTLDRVIPTGIPTGTNIPFGTSDSELADRHTRIRKWDEKLTVDANGLLTGSNNWIPLEDGVEIRFNPGPSGTFKVGDFNVGDFWVFAARTADGSVEELKAAAPRGIIHHYCQLATIINPPGSLAGQGQVIDCRHLWPDACGCCCFITVGNDPQNPGDFPDLESAVAALPYVAPDLTKLVQICLLPGEYVLSKNILIGRSGVTVRGCGSSSHITSDGNILSIAGDNCCLESLQVSGNSDQPLILVGGQNCSILGNVLTNSVGFALQTLQTVLAGFEDLLIRDNVVSSTKGIDVCARNSIVARNRLENGPLGLRVGCNAVSVETNEITSSADAGILLGTGTSGGVSGLLSDIDIVDNRIVGASGSGITTAAFDPNDLTQILVDGLRIIENQITGCVGASAPTGSNAPTFGGIVLASANHLTIRNNRIENNGQSASVAVCGIYVAHSKGFEASGNQILNNGPPWNGSPINGPEGGILALDASVTTEIGLSLDSNATPSFFPGDGFPAALIFANTVATQCGLALYLGGTGPMVVQGNSLMSKSLTQISTQTSAEGKLRSLQVGAVVIENQGTAAFDPKLLSTLGFDLKAGPGAGYGWGGNVIVDGRVQFLGNSVTLDLTELGSEYTSDAAMAGIGTGVYHVPVTNLTSYYAPPNKQPPPDPFPASVYISSRDDLNASENQMACHLGAASLGANLIVYGTTAREIGNGLMETPNRCSYSLFSVGAANTCADNQGMHCIIPTVTNAMGNLLVNRDNIVLHPNPDICPRRA